MGPHEAFAMFSSWTHCCRGAETQRQCCTTGNIKPVEIISAPTRPQKDFDRRIDEIGEVGIRVDLSPHECRALRGVGSPAPLGRGIVRQGHSAPAQAFVNP